MNALALTISDISIRQDDQGRYCLNDLHKASGGEQKHRPQYWLATQQAIDLITEIEIAGIPAILTKQGLGTFAIKELVYSYGMWISASFSLKVIRAYDALVTGQPFGNTEQLPEPKTKKSLPGGLTLEQQDTIKALVKANAEGLPKDKQAGAIIKQWAAIKKKFGCSYKEVAPENFVSIISLLSRLPVEGELLSKEADSDLVGILTSRIKTLEGELMPKDCPKYSAPKSDLKVSNRLGRTAWLTYPEMKKQDCLYKLLHTLKRDSHDVEGAIGEYNGLWTLLNDFYHRLDVMKGVFEAIDRRGRNVTFE